MNFVGILKKSQLYRVGRGLQAESFGFKKVGFGSEMENPHHWKFCL